MTAGLSASSGASVPGVGDLTALLGKHASRGLADPVRVWNKERHRSEWGPALWCCACSWRGPDHRRHVAEVIAASGVVVSTAEVRARAEAIVGEHEELLSEFEDGFTEGAKQLRDDLLAGLAGTDGSEGR